MEIQIPLVIFTSFLAWAAGIFGTQCILALQKRGGAVQLPALICSAVVLVVGGIAVVFHLTHPFNLFNGFGHITSGITQELIAIVLLAVVMVLFFLMLRRSEDSTVPQWLAVVGLVVVLVLIVPFALGFICFIVNLTAIGYYQSLERVGIASGFALLRGFVFLVPSFLFMPRLCGTEGIWLAMPLSELLTALVILGVSLWRRQRIG